MRWAISDHLIIILSHHSWLFPHVFQKPMPPGLLPPKRRPRVVRSKEKKEHLKDEGAQRGEPPRPLSFPTLCVVRSCSETGMLHAPERSCVPERLQEIPLHRMDLPCTTTHSKLRYSCHSSEEELTFLNIWKISDPGFRTSWFQTKKYQIIPVLRILNQFDFFFFF